MAGEHESIKSHEEAFRRIEDFMKETNHSLLQLNMSVGGTDKEILFLKGNQKEQKEQIAALVELTSTIKGMSTDIKEMSGSIQSMVAEQIKFTGIVSGFEDLKKKVDALENKPGKTALKWLDKALDFFFVAALG